MHLEDISQPFGASSEADVLGCLEGSSVSTTRKFSCIQAWRCCVYTKINNAARALIRSLTTCVVRFTRDAHCSERLLVTTSHHIGGC